jgi:hypothetical protein
VTNTEYNRLLSLIRRTVALGKVAAKERHATLKAEFEQQLDQRYCYDSDKVWSEAVKVAKKVVAQAQAQVEERCRELGIPKAFAPGLDCRWYDRGRNAVAAERQEMRRVAYTRLESLLSKAVFALERRGLELQTKITAGTLQSADAKEFLTGIHSIEKLMPSLSLKELTQGAKLQGASEDE